MFAWQFGSAATDIEAMPSVLGECVEELLPHAG